MRRQEFVFTFLVLDRGTGSRPKEEVQKLQAAHIGNLERLGKTGVCPLAGPLQDPTKHKRGIVVLREPGGPREAAKHFREDPYITERIMGVEPHAMEALALDVTGTYEEGIAEYVIAWIEGPTGRAASEGPVPDLDRLLRLPWPERPRVLLRRTDQRDPLLAVMIFPKAGTAAVQALLEQDEALRPGRGPWKTHVWRQWLSKGVLK